MVIYVLCVKTPCFWKYFAGRTEPNIGHIIELISTVRSLREEMANSKKGDHSHSKKSFQDILKTIQDQVIIFLFANVGNQDNVILDVDGVILR